MTKRRISFIRHYYGYTGGHQKVRDYIDHFLSFSWEPSLYVSNKANTNANLFDDISGVQYQEYYEPSEADIVFLAGTDWHAFFEWQPELTKQKKVINLIQSVRHAEPGTELFSFLKMPAIRVCVSETVRQAILPYANGPCYTIDIGHNIPDITARVSRDIYILGAKQPALSTSLAQWCEAQGWPTLCHSQMKERKDVYEAMASSRLTVALPLEREGFYLPGIEAMKLSQLAVVPDCVANREYMAWWNNGILCNYNEQDIRFAISRAMNMHPLMCRCKKHFSRIILAKHLIQKERSTLKKVLMKEGLY